MPSRRIGGDTFDVKERADGTVTAFVIDVAGHGATAALASVAAHLTVVQALEGRRRSEGLPQLVARINAAWPQELPYFTLLIVDLDPARGKGCMVQAGHPAPFISSEGGVVPIAGHGGPPIGVLRAPVYAQAAFAFGAQDRLVMVTDGVADAMNGEQEIFSEDRLRAVLELSLSEPRDLLIDRLVSTLEVWRGSTAPDDDITILVLEGARDNEDDGVEIGTSGRVSLARAAA